MLQKAKTAKEDQDTQNILKKLNPERGHFQMCTKTSQRNGQHKRLQDAIKTKGMGMLTE